MKNKVLIKRRVLNDYINIVNKRGEILRNIGSDFENIVNTKDSNIYYFNKYYNLNYLQEIEKLFELLSP